MKKAFTMAEVLITLGIIGIVAAMTLPTLIKNHQRKETEARLKKAYSTISQAFMAAQAKHGEVKDWPEWDNAEYILEYYIKPELKGAKVFPSSSETASNLMCFEGEFVGSYINGNKDSTQYGWMDNVYISSPFLKNDTASIKLMDGTCIGLNSNKNKNYPKQLFIDTNGSSQGPNIAGYDLFFFVVVENNIKPVGYNWTSYALTDASKTHACNPKSPAGGMVCAAKVMSDSWKIKYW